MKFKVGVKVKCLDGSKKIGTQNIVPQIGEFYRVVSECDDCKGWIYIRDIYGTQSDDGWCEKLFEPCTELEYIEKVVNAGISMSLKKERFSYSVPPMKGKTYMSKMLQEESVKEPNRVCIVVVLQGGREFLFENDGLTLFENNKVIVDTKNGNLSGTVVKAIRVDRSSLKDIAKVYGATLPLRKVLLTYRDTN